MVDGQQTVTVNGTREALHDESLELLLRRLGQAQTQGVAVAVNDAVVPRSQWNATRLSHGDRIEIVVAVQGG